jgi:hypothetical protein
LSDAQRRCEWRDWFPKTSPRPPAPPGGTWIASLSREPSLDLEQMASPAWASERAWCILVFPEAGVAGRASEELLTVRALKHVCRTGTTSRRARRPCRHG